MPRLYSGTKSGRCAMIFRFGKVSKSSVFDERKTPLRWLLDAIMMLTFFDAVVIAIATCSYRDSNMMLSTCVHVVIKLTTRCQFEVRSSGVDEVQGKSVYLCRNGRLLSERLSSFSIIIEEEIPQKEDRTVRCVRTPASCRNGTRKFFGRQNGTNKKAPPKKCFFIS